MNSPINYVDYRGMDAVVLFDQDALGHIGIMVQDEDDIWWHYYWGTEGGMVNFPTRIMCVFDISVEPYSWCVNFTGDSPSLSDINKSNQYTGDYEIMHYFTGDFTAAIDSMQNYSEQYNLYSNNCSQVSLRILASANKTYRELFTEAAEKMLPRNAHKYIEENKSYYFLEDIRNRIASMLR